MATEYWGVRNRLTGRLQSCKGTKHVMLLRHFEHAEAKCEAMNKTAGVNVYVVVQLSKPQATEGM